jgi:hypothetical protein
MTKDTTVAINGPKARTPEYYREWRKKNPDKQKAIMDRFYAKKYRKFAEAYNADLQEIQAQLKE